MPFWYQSSIKIEYELKRCSKKECCKQCRHVKSNNTMTKRPVQKQTKSSTKTCAHQDATDIQKKTFLCFSNCSIFIFIYDFLNDFSKKG